MTTSSKGMKSMSNYIKEIIRLLRVKHYIKNILVFIPLLFSQQLFTAHFYSVIGGFAVFCCASSVIYILNDLRDVERDRLHPVKKNRPIASGTVSRGQAHGILAVLMLLTLSGNYFINGFDLSAWLAVLGYLGINTLYSLGCKNIALLDIALLVSGYVIRVLYGAVIIQSDVSNWLYLTIIAISFYLVLGKRRNEISRYGGEARKVLLSYNQNFLDKNMYSFLTLTIVFYSLWSMQLSERFGSILLIATVPLVIIIIMRYSLIIEKDSDGDPIEVILGDKPLLLLGGLYGLTMLLILYGPTTGV